MFDRDLIRKGNLDHSDEFAAPRTGKNVYPFQICPKFSERNSWLPPAEQDCFFCKYAYFGLENDVALEVGICCWPEVQVK